MNPNYQNHSASALRTIVIHEMRKFALALEYGSTLSDLQEIRDQIKEITDLLTIKEQEETNRMNMEIHPQSNMQPASSD